MRSCPAAAIETPKSSATSLRIGERTSTPAWLAKSARKRTSDGDANVSRRAMTAASPHGGAATMRPARVSRVENRTPVLRLAAGARRPRAPRGRAPAAPPSSPARATRRRAPPARRRRRSRGTPRVTGSGRIGRRPGRQPLRSSRSASSARSPSLRFGQCSARRPASPRRSSSARSATSASGAGRRCDPGRGRTPTARRGRGRRGPCGSGTASSFPRCSRSSRGRCPA